MRVTLLSLQHPQKGVGDDKCELPYSRYNTLKKGIVIAYCYCLLRLLGPIAYCLLPIASCENFLCEPMLCMPQEQLCHWIRLIHAPLANSAKHTEMPWCPIGPIIDRLEASRVCVRCECCATFNLLGRVCQCVHSCARPRNTGRGLGFLILHAQIFSCI